MPRDYRLYLDDILQSIEQIQAYLEGMAYEQFEADARTVDAVVRNLEILGEAARNLPDAVKTDAPQIEWRKVVGMRNLLVHRYFGINTRVVWDIVQTQVKPLYTACRTALERKPETSGGCDGPA